jgi:MFS transporter, MFS domain-containing protein family, molybdate-anion transporter
MVYKVIASLITVGDVRCRHQPSQGLWSHRASDFSLPSTGTHLYVLYESYGFSVASLYSLGFFAGAVTAPILGPCIDKYGRKKAALLYCGLEVFINHLEQYPFFAGLVISRVVGGITTNLLNVVFEAWIDTEYRIKGLPKEKYEILMRDSVIVSNLAAIASGWLAHALAETLGPVGPFEGAVTCTAIAFAVIFVLWNENYGRIGGEELNNNFKDAIDTFKAIKSDTKVLRLCVIQGLSHGSLHIVIFLWSPLLKDFAQGASQAGNAHWWGMDRDHAPAYGLIFGAYMAAGVLGGLVSSAFRKLLAFLLAALSGYRAEAKAVGSDFFSEAPQQTNIEFQCAFCYLLCSLVLLVPCFMVPSAGHSFSFALAMFLLYEFIVGLYSPCEGTIRAKYIPAESRGSVMVIPTVIVNISVAVAVLSTETVSKQVSLAFVSILLAVAGSLQLTLVSLDWSYVTGLVSSKKPFPSAQKVDMAFKLNSDSVHDTSITAQDHPSISCITVKPAHRPTKKAV